MTSADGAVAPSAGRGWPATWKTLSALALLAFALRVVHVLFMRASPFFDQPIMDAAYHVDWARAFAAGERFQDGPFFRAPLYPWFLGVCQWLFGESLLAPRLVQAAFGAATAVLAYLVGERATGDRRAGWVAGIAAATSWVLIYFDGELLIPTLIVPLDLAALWLTLGLADRPAPRRAALCGLVWGLSAIARPNVLLFLPFVAAWLAWRSRPAWRASLAPIGALAAGVLLPILPITAHNRIAGGDWVLISSQGGVNLWIGNNPSTDGSTAIVPGTRGGWWEGYHDSIALAEAEAGRPLKASEVSRHYAEKAWSWMLAEPAAALRNLAWKLRLFWTDAELGNNNDVTFFAHHFDPLLRFLPVRFAPLVGLGLLGFLLALRRGSRAFPVQGFLVVYSASIVAFFVCSRFRVPVLPVLMVLGGEALVWTWDRARAAVARRSVPPALIGGVGLAVLVTFLATRRPPELVPSAANGRLQLGVAAMRGGRHDEAIRHFEAALDHHPRHLFAHRGLADAARLEGDPARAERVLRHALALVEQDEKGGRRKPGAIELRVSLIDTLSAMGQHDRAEAEARRFLARDPGQPLLRFALARAYAYRGDFERARSELRAILASHPALEDVRRALADVEEAIERSGG